MKTPQRASRLVAVLAVLALLATACGGESTSVENADGVTVAGGTPFVASTGTSVNNGLPAVNVLDLSNGEVVNFSTAAPSDKTLVLWFWAPH